MLNSLKSGNRLRIDFAKNPQKIESGKSEDFVNIKD